MMTTMMMIKVILIITFMFCHNVVTPEVVRRCWPATSELDLYNFLIQYSFIAAEAWEPA